MQEAWIDVDRVGERHEQSCIWWVKQKDMLGWGSHIGIRLVGLCGDGLTHLGSGLGRKGVVGQVAGRREEGGRYVFGR